jgi:hypothetical protein
MNCQIENLNKEQLKKTFQRLKKDTKRFSKLIVRDPLDNVDFEINLEANLTQLIFEIERYNYNPKRPYLHPSAKTKGINRPTVVFDIKDTLLFRFCIEQIENELFSKTRQKHVRGGIKITANRNLNGDDFYEKWIEDWKQHLENIQESLSHNNFVVTTDIASYFENINLLVLKDMIRSDVEGKRNLLNLLFYFLEIARFRVNYEVNTFNGLPQEDIDCSRILAYYFLHPHDEAIAEFCRECDAEYYRFVDDMTIPVNTEVIGRKALRCMTESLRRLNLVSSIEKTSILTSSEAQNQFFFEENKRLSEFENTLLTTLKDKKEVTQILHELETYYLFLTENGKDNNKHWNKILKRFYTLFTYGKGSFFLDKIKDQIIKYPALFSDIKICKYLIRNRENQGFSETLLDIIHYLYSEENLYPALETNLLETFLFFDPGDINEEIKERLSVLSEKIFFKKNYNPLSDYARALSCLLCYSFNKENLDNLANHYLRYRQDDYLLKKYIIFVSLIVENHYLKEKVLSGSFHKFL